jgi:putative flippase GtrA
LSAVWDWAYPLATLVAVEAAILHNFFWHERWTWADRPEPGPAIQRLLRFHLATGVTSLVGNVVATALAVEVLHLPTLFANTLAVATMSLANFLISDRWVFNRSGIALAVVLLGVMPGNATAASPGVNTLAAWNHHVAQIEATLVEHETDPLPAGVEGRSISVDGGTIHEWRGFTVIRAMTVSRLVTSLNNRGLPPPADDILDSRVLRRSGDALHVYIRISRSAVVTVTYDTEHDVTFVRRSATLATSRSRSTMIREIDGGDHGFLWRLNSYWRYQQRGNDVVVDVLSVSLSRDVPVLVRPVAAPLIDHVARESMQRTLEAVNRFGSALGGNGGRLMDNPEVLPRRQLRGARTSTPAERSPAFIHAAIDAAPAVSP